MPLCLVPCIISDPVVVRCLPSTPSRLPVATKTFVCSLLPHASSRAERPVVHRPVTYLDGFRRRVAAKSYLDASSLDLFLSPSLSHPPFRHIKPVQQHPTSRHPVLSSARRESAGSKQVARFALHCPAVTLLLHQVQLWSRLPRKCCINAASAFLLPAPQPIAAPGISPFSQQHRQASVSPVSPSLACLVLSLAAIIILPSSFILYYAFAFPLRSSSRLSHDRRPSPSPQCPTTHGGSRCRCPRSASTCLAVAQDPHAHRLQPPPTGTLSSNHHRRRSNAHTQSRRRHPQARRDLRICASRTSDRRVPAVSPPTPRHRRQAPSPDEQKSTPKASMTRLSSESSSSWRRQGIAPTY